MRCMHARITRCFSAESFIRATAINCGYLWLKRRRIKCGSASGDFFILFIFIFIRAYILKHKQKPIIHKVVYQVFLAWYIDKVITSKWFNPVFAARFHNNWYHKRNMQCFIKTNAPTVLLLNPAWRTKFLIILQTIQRQRLLFFLFLD